MPSLGITVTIQRVGVLEQSALTARTIPVNGNPFNIKRAFSPPVLGETATSSLYRTGYFHCLHVAP